MASLNMTPLAEMHLLLREHGWEPDMEDDDCWSWTLAGRQDVEILTYQSGHWGELGDLGQRWVERTSVEALRKRLKELAQQE